MKKNLSCALTSVLMLAITVVLIAGCDKKKESTHEEELSERISTVRMDDGTYNLVNTETGKTLIKDIDVDWVQTGRDSLAVFSQDKKRGYFNVNTGEIIIEPTYKHAWVFSEGLAGVVKDDMIGFINPQGEVVIDFRFPYRGNSLTSFVFHDGRCVVADANQKIGAIDTLGNWIVQPNYDHVILTKDYAVVSVTGEFNKQLSYDGRVILDCVIDNILDIYYDKSYINLQTGCPSEERVASNEFFEYKVSGRSGLMNDKGEFITKPIYTTIYGLGPHLFRAILLDGHSEVLINERGQVLSKMK
ncbi:MAG: WG repeat-containing protein [Paludibacteraceae bacterium]|nr:WG repeat-containing protein [Paludibacteraceae bacterium]